MLIDVCQRGDWGAALGCVWGRLAPANREFESNGELIRPNISMFFNYCVRMFVFTNLTNCLSCFLFVIKPLYFSYTG